MLHPGDFKAAVKTLLLSHNEIPGSATSELRLPLLVKSASTGTAPWKSQPGKVRESLSIEPSNERV